MKGPRIIFKDDRDSGVGRGAHLHAGHFRPEMARVIYEAGRTAPHGVKAIVISEAWRSIRETRDLHKEGRAFDLSLNVVEGDFAARKASGDDWGNRLRMKLGPDYDIKVHGSGANLHIHIELDP
jgi:hypothetical protein